MFFLQKKEKPHGFSLRYYLEWNSKKVIQMRPPILLPTLRPRQCPRQLPLHIYHPLGVLPGRSRIRHSFIIFLRRIPHPTREQHLLFRSRVGRNAQVLFFYTNSDLKYPPAYFQILRFLIAMDFFCGNKIALVPLLWHPDVSNCFLSNMTISCG